MRRSRDGAEASLLAEALFFTQIPAPWRGELRQARVGPEARLHLLLDLVAQRAVPGVEFVDLQLGQVGLGPLPDP